MLEVIRFCLDEHRYLLSQLIFPVRFLDPVSQIIFQFISSLPMNRDWVDMISLIDLTGLVSAIGLADLIGGSV